MQVDVTRHALLSLSGPRIEALAMQEEATQGRSLTRWLCLSFEA